MGDSEIISGFFFFFTVIGQINKQQKRQMSTALDTDNIREGGMIQQMMKFGIRLS